MILSGVAGTLYSVYDLVRGRGIVVESISPESPLQLLQVHAGDAIWRIDKRRVYSVADIDARLRESTAGTKLSFSLISQGEHVERPGLLVTDDIKQRPSPSGITGSRATHRFRASGWTAHYETFCEILQILAQLAFGLALANYKNHGLNRRARLAFAAAMLITFGIAFTAMRTALVALAIGICVISYRALGGRARVLSVSLVLLVLVFGAFVVSQTRACKCLMAARSQFLVARSGGCGGTETSHDSSALRAWHGLKSFALDGVGISGSRNDPHAFNTAANRLSTGASPH